MCIERTKRIRSELKRASEDSLGMTVGEIEFITGFERDEIRETLGAMVESGDARAVQSEGCFSIYSYVDKDVS